MRSVQSGLNAIRLAVKTCDNAAQATFFVRLQLIPDDALAQVTEQMAQMPKKLDLLMPEPSSLR